MRFVNAAVHLLLRTPLLHRILDESVCELRFAGKRSGRSVALPVMYAQRGDQVVVLVGGSAEKRWWRNFSHPHPVQVLLHGVSRAGIGHVVPAGATDRDEARSVYAARFPDLPAEDDPFVAITLTPMR
jgi:hypothetical protein